MPLDAEQLVPLPGYYQDWGTKHIFIGEFAGPADYDEGTGHEMTAAQLGWGGFDAADIMGFSLSGTYFGRVQLGDAVAADGNPAGSVPNIFVRWFTTADGLEVTDTTDLSLEVLRLFAVGV